MTEQSSAVEFQAIPAQRAVTLTRAAAGFGSELIGPVVGPMFPEVLALLDAAGVPSGPAIAVYTGDGSGVLVTAGFLVEDDVAEVPGAEVQLIQAVPRAAVLLHHGPTVGLDVAWTTLMAEIRASGSRPSGAGREVYLTPPDRPQEEWVTRLVQPVD